MNKKEFLETLEKKLSILNEKERQDIIDEYKDTISEKVKHGQKEKDAIKDFGDIDDLVSEILGAYKIDPEYNKKDETSFEKFINDGETLIKNGANKLAQASKDFADNFKENNTEINLSLVFEIIIKIFFTMLLLGILKLPFMLFENIGFDIFFGLFSPADKILHVIFKLVLTLIYLGLSILIVISMFKQYFENTKENKLSSKDNNEKPKNAKKTQEKKEVKASKNNGPSLGYIVMFIIKIWTVIIFIIPLFFVDLGLIMAISVSVFYLIKGIDLLGLILLLIGLLLIFVSITIALYNLVFGKKLNLLIPVIVGTVLLVLGNIFFVDMLMSIEYIDKAPNITEMKTQTKTFTTDKKVLISFPESDTKKTIDDNMPDGTFIIKNTYNNKVHNIEIDNYDNYRFTEDDCYEGTCNNSEVYNYITIHNIGKSKATSFKETYNQFIKDLKKKKIHNYSKMYVNNIEVIANTKTMAMIEI